MSMNVGWSEVCWRVAGYVGVEELDGQEFTELQPMCRRARLHVISVVHLPFFRTTHLTPISLKDFFFRGKRNAADKGSVIIHALVMSFVS